MRSSADLGAASREAPMPTRGAIAVREAARRSGRGWPPMILLALAYAII